MISFPLKQDLIEHLISSPTNTIVRLQCMRNLNYSEGVGSTYSLSLKTAMLDGHRGHKEVLVAHIISKSWEKTLLPLQERVKILVKSVEEDAVILYKVLSIIRLVNCRVGAAFIDSHRKALWH